MPEAAVPGGAAPVADGEAVVAAARAGEPDRYLAALLAAPADRGGLVALAAFSAELARVPRLVTHEVAIGEIRLHWWRDALALPAAERTGNPTADAVRAAAARYKLPADLLNGMIDARTLDLEASPLADGPALADYLWKTEGALFALGGRVVGLPQGPEADTAAAAAGQAYGLARLLLGLPGMLARGRLPLPLSRLAAGGVLPEDLLAGGGDGRIAELLSGLYADVRAHLVPAQQFAANLPRAQRIAFLPLALVGSYLRVLERPGREPLREEAQIAPLARVGRIAAGHWFGRL